MEIEEFIDLTQTIELEVAKVVVGQTDIVRTTVIAIIAGQHALLEGVPGLGKTLLIRTLAEVLDLTFSRIQFTPDLMPSDIVGTDILKQTESGNREFEFQSGPIFANLILADEINRATPKTQSAMLEVMQENKITVGKTTYTMTPPFFVLATQNPIEQEGTYPLPEAQLDRFIFKLKVQYPSVDELVTIIDRTTRYEVAMPEKLASGQQIVQMRHVALNVPVPSHVTEYVARLVVASHPENEASPSVVRDYLQYGSSPRGAQALIIGSKIHALLEGRFNVSFDDIHAIAPAALRHRFLLNYDALAEGITSDEIIQALLEEVPQMAH